MDWLNSLSGSAIGRVLFSGAVVNFVIVIVGSLIGLLFKKGISARLNNALMTGMALCVFLIGVSGMLKGKNALVSILSMAVGCIIGELLNLDRLVNKTAAKLEAIINRKGNNAKIAEGFTTATLLFCIGAMTIVGSIDSGLSGNNTTLYSKSIIDAISSVAFASSLGVGVLFAAIPVLLIEGGLTLLASFLAPLLSNTYIIDEMSCVGSLLVVALSLNMLSITKIKVMNLVPAIFMPILFCQFL